MASPEVQAKINKFENFFKSLKNPKNKENFYTEGIKKHFQKSLANLIVNNTHILRMEETQKAKNIILQSIKEAILNPHLAEKFTDIMTDHNIQKHNGTLKTELQRFSTEIDKAIKNGKPIPAATVQEMSEKLLNKFAKEVIKTDGNKSNLTHNNTKNEAVNEKKALEQLSKSIAAKYNLTSGSRKKLTNIIETVCKQCKINPTDTHTRTTMHNLVDHGISKVLTMIKLSKILPDKPTMFIPTEEISNIVLRMASLHNASKALQEKIGNKIILNESQNQSQNTRLPNNQNRGSSIKGI